MYALPLRDANSVEDAMEALPLWRRAAPVVLGIALAVALLILLIIARQVSDERQDALALQRHSYEVIVLARNAEGTVARAESLLARYVLSLDANDGRRYADEWRTAGTVIASLKRAVRDNAAQTARMANVEAAYQERGKALDDIALRTTYDQKLGALGRLYEANRVASADRLHRLLEDVITQEVALLDRRSNAVDQQEGRAQTLASSYALIALIILVAALAALWIAQSAANERHFQRRLAHAEARRVDDLELAVTERTNELAAANVRLREEMVERAQAEESLRQLHKMEAVGQLTGGIAHDFNNMLAVVMGGLEMAKRRAAGNEEAQRHIDNALEGAVRAASLTRRLLAFARAEPLTPTTIDPDQLIAEMAALIDRTIGDGIAVAMAPGAGDWHLWADRHQLENSLINLSVNARDAMDGQGRLVIATGRATIRNGELSDCPAGDYVRLSVKDSGHGMTPDVLSRVFEPFFTTKPVGRGTGLGLSQVFAFVRQANGGIRIHTEPGTGTEVEIFLPRADAPVPPDAPAATPQAQEDCAPETTRTILVVEDDARVLASTIMALTELGHTTIGCANPAKAAEALAANPEVDLILTDVLMPDMTGPEMMAALRRSGVGLPVVYVTGFGGEDAEAGLLVNENVLRKPFTLAQLGRMVDSVPKMPRPALSG